MIFSSAFLFDVKGEDIMYQLLNDPRFFDLLVKLDKDVAAEVRARGCECGGALHSARYPRKPRGGPDTLGSEANFRFSFCCAMEGCRRRVTPSSLRFLGRKVFFGVIVLLVPVLRDGATPARLGRLAKRFHVSEQTVRRWVRFWRQTFATSRTWQAARGFFATPVSSEAMPASLVDAFSRIGDLQARLAAIMEMVSGTGLRGSSRFLMSVTDPQKMALGHHD